MKKYKFNNHQKENFDGNPYSNHRGKIGTRSIPHRKFNPSFETQTFYIIKEIHQEIEKLWKEVAYLKSKNRGYINGNR